MVRPKTPFKKTGPPVLPKPTGHNNGADKEPVEVFCRLRPLNNYTDLIAVQKVVTNNRLLRLCPPNGSRNELLYKFKHVFDDKTSQKQLFDQIALPLATDLLNGKNGLLFTYGITSSGKTYTIVGTPSEPGILPRTLDILFNTLNQNNLQSRKYVFKADGQNYFEIQSSPDALLQLQKEQREKYIPKTPSSTPFASKTPRSTRKRENNGEEWDQRLKDTSVVEEINCDNNYAIFVSYFEIYNNYIYDLLDETIDVFRSNRQPQSKVLREDNRKRVFVSGGAEIEVKSADEAFELFIKGVRRRRIAHTALNAESSRSHSVFTVRVVQAPIDSSGAEVLQDDRFLVASQLSIVDLAGSERSVRTMNRGDRQQEGSNINKSLMALRNCMDYLRDKQLYPNSNKVFPFREYKLTHLFKSYFEGEGRVRMVICVSPSADDYNETLHVMKFAEQSQEVMISKAVNRFHRFETMPKFYDLGSVDLAAINVIGPPFPNSYLEDPEDDKVFPEWLECLEERKKNKEIGIENHKRNQLMVRQRISEMEKENMFLKQQMAVMQMDLAARQDQLRNYENKCFRTEQICDTHQKKVAEMDRKIRALEQSVEEKHSQFTNSELERERMKARMRERLDSERDRLKNIFERILAEKQAQLEKEQCVAKDKWNLVKQILNADNTSVDYFKDYRDLLYPASNSALRPSSGPDSQASTQTPQTVLKRKSEFEFANYGTPVPGTASNSNNPSNTPQTIGSVGTESTPLHNPPPTCNPRHRRSLSTGDERWIDHRPPGTIELGTVLRPKIKNKKSVSNLKASDILKESASKYALTHHEADPNGQIETQVFKGEVIPSSSGGAQVIFNDVETLKQSSPPIRKRTVSETRVTTPQVTHSKEPVNPFSKRSRH